MGKKVKLRESSEKESKLVRITHAPSQKQLMLGPPKFRIIYPKPYIREEKEFTKRVNY